MSFGIVRIQKFASGSCGGIQIHDRRLKDYSHTNKDINFELSHLNYNLHQEHDEKKSFRALANERISELGLTRKVRKDAVVMAQALVTSDSQFFKGLSQKEQEKFFRDSYEFLCRKYGEENCVSAYVHPDEATPHMHFNFVPVMMVNCLPKDFLHRLPCGVYRMSFISRSGKVLDWSGERSGVRRGIRLFWSIKFLLPR
jgi:hypothetical protein